MDKEILLEKYNALKKELDQIRDDMTLSKYKILTDAFKLGKKIYGKRYSNYRLSFDFEVPYTTVRRIRSLDKANRETWKLINKKKISSFKVAQILHQHGPTYQDEIIKMTIEKNLSTYDIRELRCRTLADIKEERLRIAVRNGFARSSVAYRSFQTAIERLHTLTTIEVEYLPRKKLLILSQEIVELIKGLEKFDLSLNMVESTSRRNKNE